VARGLRRGSETVDLLFARSATVPSGMMCHCGARCMRASGHGITAVAMCHGVVTEKAIEVITVRRESGERRRWLGKWDCTHVTQAQVPAVEEPYVLL
jgi:hypothetical protein